MEKIDYSLFPDMPKSQVRRLLKVQEKEYRELERKEELRRKENERIRRDNERIDREREESRRREGELSKVKEALGEEDLAYYQEKTGFVHKGIITFAELEQHEAHIKGKKKADKRFIRDFRLRLTEMTMVDHQFGRIISEVSPEYEELVKKAEKEEEKLNYTANVSGIQKVMHGVTTGEKTKAKEKLKELKLARQAKQRAKFDTKDRKDAWAQKKSEKKLRDYQTLADEFTGQDDFCSEITEEAFAVQKEKYVSRGYETAQHDSKSILQHAKDFSEKTVYKDGGKTIVRGCAMLLQDKVHGIKARDFDEYAVNPGEITLERVNGHVDWKDVVYKTRDVLYACGEGKMEDRERKESIEQVRKDIDTWGIHLGHREVIMKLEEAKGDPAVYLDDAFREEISDLYQECRGVEALIDCVETGWAYGKLLSEEEKAQFDSLRRWTSGYMEYLGGIMNHIRAWDKYFSASDEQKAKMAPDTLPAIPKHRVRCLGY